MRSPHSPAAAYLSRIPSDSVVIRETHSPRRNVSANNRKGKTQIGIKQKIKEITSSDNNLKAAAVGRGKKNGAVNMMQFRHTTDSFHVSNTPSISRDGLFLPQPLKQSLMTKRP